MTHEHYTRHKSNTHVYRPSETAPKIPRCLVDEGIRTLYHRGVIERCAAAASYGRKNLKHPMWVKLCGKSRSIVEREGEPVARIGRKNHPDHLILLACRGNRVRVCVADRRPSGQIRLVYGQLLKQRE